MPHPDMSAHWEGGHPDEGLLHEWLDEQLSAEAASHIALHVAACAECAGVVAEARGLIAASRRILSALDEVPGNVVPASTAGARTVAPRARRVAPTPWRRIGTIAAVLVVAVATPFVLRDRSVTAPLQSPSPTVSEVAQGGAAGAGAAVAVGADGVTPSERLAERPAASAMQAPVTSRSVAKAASGVVNNEPARDDATAKAAAVNPATADRASADPALSGRVTAERAKTAIGAAAASVASADITNANVATQLRADSVMPQRASVGAVAAGGVAKAVEPRSSARRSFTAAAPMAAPPPAASDKSMGFADASGIALFDSITVMRSVCDPSCIATTLHISALGVLRYTIGAGPNERVVRSQLSAADRTRLASLVMRQFSAAEDRRGLVACSVPMEPQMPLRIDIAFGSAVVPAIPPRCAASPSQVRALGDSIDAIVGARGMP